MRILIAEDDAALRAALCETVIMWGYEPIPVENGRKAWEILQQDDPPKLVLLDWNMPEMNGIEVCRSVRGMEPVDQPYLVLLTDRPDKEDVVRGLEEGANDCMAKPWDNAELCARISAARHQVKLQTRLVEALDALEFQGMHDPLTGAFNRRSILGMLGKELERLKRFGSTLSVAMCDLDNFGNVTDTHGHQAADDVLTGFSERIQSTLRIYDYMGRYGGEVFLVIAPGSNGTSSESLYERLRSATESAPIGTRRGDINITVSIGVAAANGESVVDKLLTEAADALKEAKSQGKNCVVYADSLNASRRAETPAEQE